MKRQSNAISPETALPDYTNRLVTLQTVWWKRLLNVQAPYRWNLQRLNLGNCLDVGCGIGRNLRNLSNGSVGVDHNEHSISVSRQQGLLAFQPDEFKTTEYAKNKYFDSMLLAHVLEHMSFEDGSSIMKSYLPYIKSGGKVVLITPQVAGYASDKTHVEFMPFSRLEDHAQALGLTVEKEYSFPFPEFVGNFFKYNEFVLVARIP